MKIKLAVLMLSCFILLLNGKGFAFGNDEQWSSGFGQGVAEALITKGPGNQIYVTCDAGAGSEATGIHFQLAGDSAAGSSVTLTFDNLDPEQFSIWDGEIISSCNACAATYEVVVAKLKKHRSVHVLFENGNSARFTLKGARKAIGQCVPDFYR